MSRSRISRIAVLAVLFALAAGSGSLTAGAEAAGLEWRLEQPTPPPPPTGVQGSETPVSLGRIGDIEFWAPNRGVLITAGNGSTVPPGVWAYNGEGWHELANACGATDGRIAWAGPDEFWTVSDGRPGQAANGQGFLPPLEDDTLCHFAGGSIVKSYAAPAFQASSYQPMHAAACISSNDCWFAGDPLPEPQPGAFHLHWTGGSLQAEANTHVHTVGDMRIFQGHLIESVALPLKEAGEEEETIEEILHPSVLQEIAPEGTTPTFTRLHPTSAASSILPEYASGAFPQALGFLRLSADEDSLWAAAGPVSEPPKESQAGQLTVLRDSAGVWSQVLGPAGTEAHAVDPPGLAADVVSAIAAEPGSSSAWLAPDTQSDLKNPNPTEPARLLHVAADGSFTEEHLPSEKQQAEGVGVKGAAYKVVCPAQNDCWMATTQGWLFHLSEEASRTLPVDRDPSFNGPLITYRPPDEGLPQVPSDAPPVDDSGLEEAHPASTPPLQTEVTQQNRFATVPVPLLSGMHTRLVHGTTLELSFRLAVRARVRLLAQRRHSIVASTPARILQAGRRKLLLRLDPHHWPTKLDLQTHALAPLPTASTRSSGVETVSTSLAFPAHLGLLGFGPSL